MSKIDIIMAFYNAEDYLEKTLESIYSQKYKDFKLIAINDGSTDNSLIYFEKYQNTNIKLITVPNGGVSKARDIGLTYSDATYVCFVDSDDYLETDYLEVFIKNSENFDLIISGYNYVNEKGEILLESKDIPYNSEDFLYGMLLDKYGYRTSLWNKMFRREMLITNNINFDEKIIIGEDMVFLGHILKTNPKINVVRDRTYNYFVNNNGAMKSIRNETQEERSYTELLAIDQFENLINSTKFKVGKVVKIKKLIITRKLLKYTQKKELKKLYKSILLENISLILASKYFTFKNKLGFLISFFK